MIDELDETLRKLLTRELNQQGLGKVEITFDRPTREWSSRLNGPTLNLFLYNIYENAQMRQMAQVTFERARVDVNAYGKNGKKNGTTPVDTINRSQPPLRMDLHYLITAWAAEPDDEHRMLGRTLLALAKYLTIPTDLRVMRDEALVPEQERPESLADDSSEHVLPSYVRALKLPVNLQIAREDVCSRLVEVWGVMDNELRPAINCIMTAPLDPYHPFDTPIVRTAQFTYMQKGREMRDNQRVYRDVVPNAQSYPRDENDTERIHKPKQTADGRAFTQIPTALTANVFVRGFIRRKDSSAPLQNLRAVLLEHMHGNPDGGSVEVKPDGTFSLFGLPAQTYTLMISADGLDSSRHPFTVPLPDPSAELKIEI